MALSGGTVMALIGGVVALAGGVFWHYLEKFSGTAWEVSWHLLRECLGTVGGCRGIVWGSLVALVEGIACHYLVGLS